MLIYVIVNTITVYGTIWSYAPLQFLHITAHQPLMQH